MGGGRRQHLAQVSLTYSFGTKKPFGTHGVAKSRSGRPRKNGRCTSRGSAMEAPWAETSMSILAIIITIIANITIVPSSPSPWMSSPSPSSYY
eukprot:3672749-Pyramimonas_sp.AAC.1